MQNRSRNRYLQFLLPLAVGIVLLFVPLLGDFHIESALLVSLVGCFWAGIRGCNKSLQRSDFGAALRIAGLLALVGFPLFVNAILTGCFSIHGLVFWLLFPLPSVFFGFAIGRLLRIWSMPYRRLLVTGLLLLIAVGTLVYELLNYPQVYFFNHVWGGWPGPVYDEVVQVNSATVFFRSLTMLWVVLLWHIPILKEGRYPKWIVGFAVIGMVFGYTQLTEVGVISPRSHLQKVLGGEEITEHFVIYYDKQLYNDYEIDLLAQEHEFYYQKISDRLSLPTQDTTDKIESYLYAHPWQKKRLVGAKFTSYVPVWLQQDQLHIAKQQIRSSLQHELVHVLAKQFGNWFNASWSIGLIEGLAVAIDGGSSATSTIDQIVVSEKPYPSSRELQRAFSPVGFYGGRSGVNYITSGSFVRFLMNNYPVSSVKQAYQTGEIANAYDTSWQQLTQKWHRHLDSVRVDSVDQKIARRIFSIPSLFEQECPHVVSDFADAFDQYRFHQASRDTASALNALNRAVAAADSLPPIKAEWSYQHLLSGDLKKVQQAATLRDTTVDLQLLYADAFAMTGNWQQAQIHIDKAQKLFHQNPDSVLEPAVKTRLDKRQWAIYRKMTYHNTLPDSATFAEVYHRTKIRSLRKAMEQERWSLVERYAQQLLKSPLRLQYFDDYLQLIHHMAFRGNGDLAKQIIDKLSANTLRNRYQERLEAEKKWLKFSIKQI